MAAILTKEDLIKGIDELQEEQDERIRRLVLFGRRTDVLAREVLGHDVAPMLHGRALEFVNTVPEAIFTSYRGAGKSVRPDTPVMMADGTIRQAKDVHRGDQLMGPDSTPRNVLEITSGVGQLYKVSQVGKPSESWVCNDQHILTLKGRAQNKGQIKDFPIKDIIAWGKELKRGTTDMPWKAFRVPVEFPARDSLPFHPYLFGVWLGDGHALASRMTLSSKAICLWVKGWAKKHGYKALVRPASWNGDKLTSVRVDLSKNRANRLRDFLVGIGAKHIPQEFLTASREERLQLLAGIIDTDGYSDPGKSYVEVTQKEERLARQIVFLARSLGFAAYVVEKTGTIASLGFVGTYWRVSLSGDLDEIPCRVPGKKPQKRTINKDPLVYGFEIEDAGVGEFIGFVLDGDKRFLLGDFTVTHNSTTCGEDLALNAILAYPDIRICYTSRTQSQARYDVGQVKYQLESNEDLHRIFGDGWVGPKWTETEFTVGRRTRTDKNPTMYAVGVGGAVAGSHVDLIICDDLVNQKNSQTQLQRDALFEWFIKELLPTLDPPVKAKGPWGKYVPFTGELKYYGTIYHPDDLTERLKEMEDYQGCHLNIPGVDDEWTETPWPERHDLDWMRKKERMLGKARFDAQFRGKSEGMKGDIIPWDIISEGLKMVRPGEWHAILGVDPAADGDSKEACEFAATVIGVTWKTVEDRISEDKKMRKILAMEGDVAAQLEEGSSAPKQIASTSESRRAKGRTRRRRTPPRKMLVPEVRILDHYSGVTPFNKQIEVVNSLIRKWNVAEMGVESNGMQLQQYKDWKAMRPDVNVVPVNQERNKVQRAFNTASMFEAKTLTIQPNRQTRGVGRLLDQLLALKMTSKQWDRHDSLDIAIQVAGHRQKRKKRAKRPRVIGGNRGKYYDDEAA